MKDEPIILITPPEVIQHGTETFNDGVVSIQKFDYTKSHVIYKGNDLGSFEELLKQKDMINSLNKKINKAINDIVITFQIIGEQPSKNVEEDNYILSRLESFINTLKGE